VFCLVTAFFFHSYWTDPAGQQMAQQINFYKNCAIAGGLFVYAFGAGRYSLVGNLE
jgi:putative oxidoreductase